MDSDFVVNLDFSRGLYLVLQEPLFSWQSLAILRRAGELWGEGKGKMEGDSLGRE